MILTCETVREKLLAESGPRAVDSAVEGHLAHCHACGELIAHLPAVDAALREIANNHVHAPPPFERIAPAVEAIARGHRRTAERRRRVPFLVTGGLAAAAAAAFAVLILGQLGKPPRLEQGAKLAPTAEKAAVAELASGARIRVETGAVELVSGKPGEEKLLLAAGAASFEVPKLGAGRSLSVATPDAGVIVHGTRFHVSREAKGTTVTVTEGLVEVRPEGGDRPAVFLKPGQSLFVEPLEVHRESLRAAAQAAVERGQYDEAHAKLEQLLRTDPPELLRAESLALEGFALSAQGNRSMAVKQYRASLAALPGGESPRWADDAAVELALLLERENPAAAADAWRSYLTRFPAGERASLARTRLNAAP